MAQISERRGFACTTIESHLAQCLELGEIAIDRLLSQEKRQALAEIILPLREQKLSAIKEIAGDAYTYGEIKYVLAYLRYQAFTID